MTPAEGMLAMAVDAQGAELFAVELRNAGASRSLQLRLVASDGGQRSASSWQDVAGHGQDLRLEWRPATPGDDARTLALYLDGRLALWLEVEGAASRPTGTWVFGPAADKAKD